jgi:ribosomal protein S18 acetylase RimI-like enzyme
MYTFRAYGDLDDRQSMIDLLIAVRPPERISDYPSIVDLQELLSIPQIQSTTRLWEDGVGQLVAFAFVDTYNNLRFEMAPRARDGEVMHQIVDWGEACVRRGGRTYGESLTLDACCREDDAGCITLLKNHGFAAQEVRSLIMARSLRYPIAEPQLPHGFGIRPITGEAEAGALVALHRAAHQTGNLTLEDRLSWMRVPEYDPALDLVATAPDGRLAAYCRCLISEEENARSGRNEGWTDPIGTHPDFQRQGLASALLLRGMFLLRERGIETARLATSSDNIPMLRTANKVGFRVESAKVWFTKPV